MKPYTQQQRKELILNELKSIKWGKSGIKLRGNILYGLEGLYPVGSEASAVHYYCVRRIPDVSRIELQECRRTGLCERIRRWFSIGKKVKSKRKSKKKSRKNNVNNKKMKTHLDQKMLKGVKTFTARSVYY